MSNRRPFSNQNNNLDFNSYYSKLNGLTNFKFARSHSSIQNNHINNNFSMNNCNTKRIVNYKSYDTLINLSKISSLLNPTCSKCLDVPVNLMNGIQSEVYYNELYEIKCHEDNICDCIKIPIINPCYEKSGKMFPYGRFNNSNKNPPIKIHSLKGIDCECEEKLECPPYIICKCSLDVNHCECCKFTTTTPLNQNTNIIYTDNYEECDNSNHLAFFEIEHMNELEEIKNKKLQEDKLLSEKAVDIYSKFG